MRNKLVKKLPEGDYLCEPKRDGFRSIIWRSGDVAHPDGRSPFPVDAKKDLPFTPLRPERVVEVRYDHMEGNRFRHTAQWVRWREDRDPESCTYEQLEEPVSYDLGSVLG